MLGNFVPSVAVYTEAQKLDVEIMDEIRDTYPVMKINARATHTSHPSVLGPPQFMIANLRYR